MMPGVRGSTAREFALLMAMLCLLAGYGLLLYQIAETKAREQAALDELSRVLDLSERAAHDTERCLDWRGEWIAGGR